ncbi:hypothetical protein OZX67_07850 [Bifidobacterium sp. ESL0728]|uniref:hypothetical protein n=1 Tax=Bifidobacterium sp. ESL0728 TaxID=2983220 RepID=UPI0023FA1915|nr:hypothetical protein [Bifidobacterium sp. ESL0728]WEV58699.1 hypothetical protein OZX67_07850 [Bifidobacterium sp. ESL0728]
MHECVRFSHPPRDTPQMWITPIIRPQYPFQLAFPAYEWIEWVYGKCIIDFKATPGRYLVSSAQKNTAASRGERQTDQKVTAAKTAFCDAAADEVAEICEIVAVSAAETYARA